MFKSQLLLELENWRQSKPRKPLVIRGARQVGKTTLVNQFATQFEQYIYLNLELSEDKEPFENFTSIEHLINTVFFLKSKTLAKKNTTLIFIDEIQEVPKALNTLRYFYELAPEISVIAAGSMLETLFDKQISFPNSSLRTIIPSSHIFWVLKLRNILLGLSKQKKPVPEMRTSF